MSTWPDDIYASQITALSAFLKQKGVLDDVASFVFAGDSSGVLAISPEYPASTMLLRIKGDDATETENLKGLLEASHIAAKIIVDFPGKHYVAIDLAQAHLIEHLQEKTVSAEDVIKEKLLNTMNEAYNNNIGSQQFQELLKKAQAEFRQQHSDIAR